jgi:Uma2 family endonuclease
MIEVRDPLVVYNKKILSEEEYLEFEKSSESKHEFFKGEVFAMAGAEIRHNIIFKNLFRDISNKLRGKPCQPYGSDMRIHIPENSLYTYPDISIICGDLLLSQKIAIRLSSHPFFSRYFRLQPKVTTAEIDSDFTEKFQHCVDMC